MKRNRLITGLLLVLLLLLPSIRLCADDLSARIPSTYAPHPRLLLRAGEEEAVRRSVARDSVLSCYDRLVMDGCERYLEAPPVERTMAGKRLLHVSREALQRIFFLSYAWRMTGENRYSDRAVKEMLAVCDFTDWNPSHYLDVGEMTMALAIGYDWLYPRMTEAQRARIREAIVEKGLKTAENPVWAHFYRGSNNWNQVCNAGLVYGALAIREDVPALSDTVIVRCLRTITRPLRQYSPEGCYPEGYSYWKYGSSFQVMLMAALESAFGSDLGISDDCGGFFRSARFMQFMSTPLGGSYNYSDSGSRAQFTYVQPWMAQRIGDASVLYPEMYLYRRFGYRPSDEDRLMPVVPIFGAKLGMAEDAFSIPEPEGHVYTCGGATPLFIYRSGWNSPLDTYLAVKGGRAADSHGHLDAGSFLFESEGFRWAVDLGSQDYLSLESRGVDLWNNRQDSQRWDVFRVGPWSHNILTVNGHRPSVTARALIPQTWDGEDGRYGAVVDVTPVLKADLDTAVRRIWLDRKMTLHVDDAVQAGREDATVRWAMCTRASVEQTGRRTFKLTAPDGQVRWLRVKGKHIVLRTWTTEHMHDYDVLNPGITMVGFEQQVPAGKKAGSRVTLSLR